MKKIALLFSGLLLITSCVDLEENPKAILTTAIFYKTPDDAIAAVNSIYNVLNNGNGTMYNRLFHMGMEIMSDDAIAGERLTNADVRELAALTHSTNNIRFETLWREHYTGINRANIAIDRIRDIDMEPTLQTRLILEAKFLRGLLYFNLVRLWGDVPLILHETDKLDKESVQVSRTAAELVYQQIIEDLTAAEKLPASYDSKDAGRATGGGAKGLLAKVYLTRQEWDKAVSKCQDVFNGPYSYELFENFRDAFDVATKNGKEHLFSVQCKSFVNAQGNRLASSATPVGIPGISAAGTDEPHPDAYLLYDPADKRRDVTFFTSITSPSNGNEYTFKPHFFKYFDPAMITNPTESARNLPVMRFAEVLLMHAEALNEQSGPVTEAYASLNRVRNRAGLSDLTPGLNQEQFRDSVYLERRLELMFEYQRWFDLIRTRRMLDVLHGIGKMNAQEKHYLLPLPQREVDVNPRLLPNNPGW